MGRSEPCDLNLSQQSGEGEGSGAARPALHDLPPDCWATIATKYISLQDTGNLLQTCRSMRQFLSENAAMWASLCRQQYPDVCARMQQPGPGGLAQGSWRQRYLSMHNACHQLRTRPVGRAWCSDDTPVAGLKLHAPGSARRLTMSCQASMVEVRPPALATEAGALCRSFQLHGHSGQVSCLAVVEPQGGSQQRLGVITGSADQTVRLWSVPAHVPPDELAAPAHLTLLTPTRTLRGHSESVTSLQLVTGAGVTIAATGAKDRTVRLWGLAPLLPSPANKNIATLRGHGAPVTCLAAVQSPQQELGQEQEHAQPTAALLSASLDSRAKLWDVWTGGCVGTARLAGPSSAMQAAAACSWLQPHGVFASAGSAVQLLDLRLMRPVATLAQPASAGPLPLCFAQWGEMLVLGGEDGARVYDLRALADSSSRPGSGGGSSRSGGSQPHRLLLQGHAGAITSVHVDRLKIVTATSAYGEDPVRVWCPDSGECMASFGSAEPQQPAGNSMGEDSLLAALAPAGDSSIGGAGPQQQLPGLPGQPGQHAAAGGGVGDAAAAQASQPGAAHGHSYHREWEGVTALACAGALLVTGNSEGMVRELDFSRGLQWGDSLGSRSHEQERTQPGKFWQYS